MANYTIELRFLENPPTQQVFSFDYDYYMKGLVTEEVYLQKKKDFEDKFINTYACEEIGFTTVDKFKLYLKSYLDNNFKYWNELYKTELQVEKDQIDFLLNKDLKEEHTSETTGTGKTNSSSNGTTESTTTGESKDQLNDTPSINLNKNNKDYATSISYNNSNNKTNASGNSTSESNSESNVKVKDTLVSRGNIGITSSAELLEKWRNVLINIDKEIIDGASDLFMQLF